MSLFRALKAPQFSLFLGGQLISAVGDSIYNISLAVWITQQVDSAQALGRVMAFALLPRLIFLMLGGLLSDRFPRVQMLIVTNIVQGITIAIVAILTALGRLELWHIYMSSLVTGMMAALALPAVTAIVPDLSSKEDLVSANSMIALGSQLTGVIGPGLGVFLVERSGYSAAFLLNSLTFFISATLLAFIQPHTHHIHEDGTGHLNLSKELSSGLLFVARNTWLWSSMLILLFVNLTGRSTMNVALPFLAEQSPEVGTKGLGWFQSAFAVGSVLGAAGIGRYRAVTRKGWLIYGAFFATGLLTAGLGLPFAFLIKVVIMFVMGACLSVNNVMWTVILQERVPGSMLGRVASFGNLSSTALLPIGFLLAGSATDMLGPEVVFLIGGVLTAALALAAILIPSTREI